jgi:predicted nucleotidyltransferase
MGTDKKRFAAIIAEYNPLHNGHVFHLKTTLDKLRPERIIIAMSGSFTQRGTPAILDKYTRAAHAMQAGADIVIELPTVFALSNAEYFAKGAVKLLSAINPDGGYLSFGSECGDASHLTETAALMLNEPDEVSAAIKTNLKSMPFPAARCEAYQSYAEKHNIALPDIKGSNNMLAVEYIKAILASKSPLIPFTIKREGAAYLDIADNGGYISSRGVRAAVSAKNFEVMKNKVPEYVFKDLHALQPKVNTAIALHKIQNMDVENIAALYDVKEGLENRIKKYADIASNYNEFAELLTTKRYTASRQRRILAYALLDITRELHDYAKEASPYFNVLAVKADKTALLSELSKRGQLFVSEAQLAASNNPLAALDYKASRVRRILTEQKGESGMIIIK